MTYGCAPAVDSPQVAFGVLMNPSRVPTAVESSCTYSVHDGEGSGEPRMAQEPALDRWGLVSRGVVEDHVDVEVGWQVASQFPGEIARV